MKIITLISFIGITLTFTTCFAQNAQDESADYLSKRWKDVATKMPAAWYGTDQAKLAADNVVISQEFEAIVVTVGHADEPMRKYLFPGPALNHWR